MRRDVRIDRGWRLLVAALAATALTLAPSEARAAAEIGEQRITVTGPDDSGAVIERSPLRVSYVDSAGRTRLQHVASADTPTVVPPTPQNRFGLGTPPTPTGYAPFSFLVGTYDVQQVNGAQWHANLVTVTKGGTLYGATEVLEATPKGEGVELLLATDDPTGRQLQAEIAPGKEGGIRAIAEPTTTDGVVAMADSFTSSAQEGFHGFGGRHDYIDQRGQSFYGWVQQQNVSSGDETGITHVTNPEGDRYLFPNGSAAAYYVHAAFVSSAGYGFLLDRPEISHWRMASDRPDAWQVDVEGTELDYTVFPGTLEEAIGGVSRLNGRHRVPPEWAQGSIIDRAVKFPLDNAEDYRAVVEDDMREIRKTGTRVDAYRIEGWEFFEGEELREVIGLVEETGIRPLLYFRLYVGKDDIGTDDPADYDEALENGWVATRANGEPYTFISNFFRRAAVIDYTDPEALQWWKGRIREALELGAKGFMQDFGEQVMRDMHFDDGSTGVTMHNRLSTLAHKATREVLDEWEAEHPGDEIFYYTRNGYSGSPGAAAYEVSNFPGDETTDWSRASGIASLTTDMLSRAVAGSYGYSTDIGGYFDIGPYEPTTKQLFIRWAEWAALSPIFRLHGSVLNGTHMPWTYDQETVRTYKRLIKLHVRARPLIRELWETAEETGLPPTRPMWLQVPDDPEAAEQDQQWMLGNDVLVAPVVVQDAREREVYFPDGCWQHPETGEKRSGPGYETVPAPLGRLVYFFRCGTRPFEPPRACEKVLGTDGPDELIGTAASEKLRGRGGDDKIEGRGGDDCLNGGPGDDLVKGGPGSDLIRPQRGSDRLFGGAGNDKIHGGPGREVLRGGPGDDFIKVIAGERDVVDCGPGEDIVHAARKDRLRNCEDVRRTKPGTGGADGTRAPANR